MSSLPLENKIAVVTGAANGIGLAIALRLARDGADIALLDFNQTAQAAACEQVQKTGQRALAIALDCTDSVQVEGAFRQIREKLGPIDILVNNVGQSARGEMSEFTDANLEMLDVLLSINLKSCIYCSHQVAAQMKALKSGKIINMTSESAVNGSPRSWDYASAKAGVIGFTRAIARELAQFGVNVNAVGPGPTRTRALDEMSKNIIDAIVAEIPMGRIAEPEDIANTVAFLASDQSSFITGQTLLVNGGHWML